MKIFLKNLFRVISIIFGVVIGVIALISIYFFTFVYRMPTHFNKDFRISPKGTVVASYELNEERDSVVFITTEASGNSESAYSSAAIYVWDSNTNKTHLIKEMSFDTPRYTTSIHLIEDSKFYVFAGNILFYIDGINIKEEYLFQPHYYTHSPVHAIFRYNFDDEKYVISFNLININGVDYAGPVRRAGGESILKNNKDNSSMIIYAKYNKDLERTHDSDSHSYWKQGTFPDNFFLSDKTEQLSIENSEFCIPDIGCLDNFEVKLMDNKYYLNKFIPTESGYLVTKNKSLLVWKNGSIFVVPSSR